MFLDQFFEATATRYPDAIAIEQGEISILITKLKKWRTAWRTF